MSGPVKSDVLIYAKDLGLVSRFYEKQLPAKVLITDSEHRVLQSADAQLIIHTIPAQYAERIDIAAPPAHREEQAIKPFFTVANLETAEQVVVESDGLMCGPGWQGPCMRARNVCDPEGNIIHLRQSRAKQAPRVDRPPTICGLRSKVLPATQGQRQACPH